MTMTYHIEADIYFLRTSEGGRISPAFSGYRPQFYYVNNNWDAQHEYPGVGFVAPGQTVHARLSFASPDEHKKNGIHVGMEFECREGSKTVARGTITKILY